MTGTDPLEIANGILPAAGEHRAAHLLRREAKMAGSTTRSCSAGRPTPSPRWRWTRTTSATSSTPAAQPGLPKGVMMTTPQLHHHGHRHGAGSYSRPVRHPRRSCPSSTPPGGRYWSTTARGAGRSSSALRLRRDTRHCPDGEGNPHQHGARSSSPGFSTSPSSTTTTSPASST